MAGEQVTEALSPSSPGGIVVNDCDDGELMTFGMAGEPYSNAVIGSLGAENRRSCVPGLRCREGVGDPLTHDEDSWDWRRNGLGPRKARVGPERCGRVVVFGSVAGLEVTGLDVADAASLVQRGEDCGHAVAAREPPFASHHAPSWVSSDVVDAQDVLAEAALVQPIAHASTGRGPQDSLARFGISDDARVEGYGDRCCGARLAGEGGERLIGDHPGPVREPVDRFGPGEVLGCCGEVDGVASVCVVAGPTAPAFVAAMVRVHRDRRMVVVMLGERAMPPAAPRVVGPWLGEMIEEGSEVGAGEDVFDPPPPASLLPGGHVAIAASVSKSWASLAVSTVCTTAPRRCSRHSARPRTSWPIHDRSRSDRANISAATSTWSGG